MRARRDSHRVVDREHMQAGVASRAIPEPESSGWTGGRREHLGAARELEGLVEKAGAQELLQVGLRIKASVCWCS